MYKTVFCPANTTHKTDRKKEEKIAHAKKDLFLARLHIVVVKGLDRSIDEVRSDPEFLDRASFPLGILVLFMSQSCGREQGEEVNK